MIPRRKLRRELRGRRNAIPPAQRSHHANALARRLGRHPAFVRARRVGAYWSNDGEIDPAPLLSAARARHKRIFLPVLRAHPYQKLWFVEMRQGSRLTRNRFGIPEPELCKRRIYLPWSLDLLLVPLVGFDSDCNRLGMGGGFYDRSLAYLRIRRHWRRPRLIGLAHECQRVEAIDTGPWDVPLDGVATEKGIWERGIRD
jgi:5-formyltetrahydrofolate cyclo-ligase